MWSFWSLLVVVAVVIHCRPILAVAVAVQVDYLQGFLALLLALNYLLLWGQGLQYRPLKTDKVIVEITLF
jgi:hypothetical protein